MTQDKEREPSSPSDALRPKNLSDFAGQQSITRDLSVILEAAASRGQLPDHLLFAGPPGLGKTSLANIIAGECGVPMVATSGPALERASVLAQMLTALRGPTVVFIDEIHRMPIHVEEILYSAMEDGMLDLKVGERSAARVIQLPLKPFCLVGATTQVGMVSAPLRSRFGFVGRVRPYDTDALAGIVARSAALMGIDIDTDGARIIAERSKGTPRVANTLLRRVRDWVQTRDGHTPEDGVSITSDVATAALDMFGVDAVGLDRTARELLELLCVQFRGGPVGLTTLAAALGDTPDTLAEVIEPHLMNCGFIVRTPRGRVATAAAYEHLGLSVPAEAIVAGASSEDEPTLPLEP